MAGTNGVKEATLSVNVFTAPGKTMLGERPRPFGEALGFDITHAHFDHRRAEFDFEEEKTK